MARLIRQGWYKVSPTQTLSIYTYHLKFRNCVFHCGIYCGASALQTIYELNKEILQFFGSRIRGLWFRAVSNQERVIVVRVWYIHWESFSIIELTTCHLVIPSQPLCYSALQTFMMKRAEILFQTKRTFKLNTYLPILNNEVIDFKYLHTSIHIYIVAFFST